MDWDAALDLQRTFENADFLRTFEGKKAAQAFASAYFAWDEARRKRGENIEARSELAKRIIRQPPLRQQAPVPKDPVLLAFPPRRVKGNSSANAQRMLARSKAEIARFHYRIELILEDGIVPAPPEDTTDDYLAKLDLDLEDQRQLRIERLVALATARKAQKLFRQVRIPLNFAVCEGMIYLNLPGCSLSPAERQFCDREIGPCAERSGAVYRPQWDQGNFQYGTLHLKWSSARLSERYRVHL